MPARRRCPVPSVLVPGAATRRHGHAGAVYLQAHRRRAAAPGQERSHHLIPGSWWRHLQPRRQDGHDQPDLLIRSIPYRGNHEPGGIGVTGHGGGDPASHAGTRTHRLHSDHPAVQPDPARTGGWLFGRSRPAA